MLFLHCWAVSRHSTGDCGLQGASTTLAGQVMAPIQVNCCLPLSHLVAQQVNAAVLPKACGLAKLAVSPGHDSNVAHMHTWAVQSCTCTGAGDARSSESGCNIVKRHAQQDATRHSPSSVSVVPG
jgi:hypothetical protein